MDTQSFLQVDNRRAPHIRRLRRALVPALIAALWALPILKPAQPRAQRHLPDLHIFQTTETVLIDAQVESPSTYDGVSTAARPRLGSLVSFQLFVPRAGGLSAFEYTVDLHNPKQSLTNAVKVASVRDWKGRPLLPTRGTQGAVHMTARFEFDKLPTSGHVATVELQPLIELEDPGPVGLTVSVSIVSDPPRRVWRMVGDQILKWY